MRMEEGKVVLIPAIRVRIYEKLNHSVDSIFSFQLDATWKMHYGFSFSLGNKLIVGTLPRMSYLGLGVVLLSGLHYVFLLDDSEERLYQARLK